MEIRQPCGPLIVKCLGPMPAQVGSQGCARCYWCSQEPLCLWAEGKGLRPSLSVLLWGGLQWEDWLWGPTLVWSQDRDNTLREGCFRAEGSGVGGVVSPGK